MWPPSLACASERPASCALSVLHAFFQAAEEVRNIFATASVHGCFFKFWSRDLFTPAQPIVRIVSHAFASFRIASRRVAREARFGGGVYSCFLPTSPTACEYSEFSEHGMEMSCRQQVFDGPRHEHVGRSKP